MIEVNLIEMDRRYVESIRWLNESLRGSPLRAIYRTGSTVGGVVVPDADVDYLAISGSNDHSPNWYNSGVLDTRTDLYVDRTTLTFRDLVSPSTIGNPSIIMYLMREKGRRRILLDGSDVFLPWLNLEDLKRTARSLGIDENTLSKLKEQFAIAHPLNL